MAALGYSAPADPVKSAAYASSSRDTRSCPGGLSVDDYAIQAAQAFVDGLSHISAFVGGCSDSHVASADTQHTSGNQQLN